MPDRLDSRVATHEVTHWRGKPVLLSTMAFFAFMILLLVICGELTRSWTHGAFPQQTGNPGPQVDSAWSQAPPQLQTHPALDLADLRIQEYRRLHVSRWSDASHTYASISIDDAMALMTQAATKGQLSQVLPAPQPATPIDLQVQKSGETQPSAQPPQNP